MSQTDLEVHVERVFEASASQLFRAWSDPAFITRWWKNLEVADLDFREGGAYRFEWKSWDGHVEGTYKTLRENEEIVFTWTGVGKDKRDENETLVTIRFQELGDNRTKMSLRHSMNMSVDVYKSHREGWMSAAKDLATEFARSIGPVDVVRTIAAKPDQVFRWLTEKNRIESWFFTKYEGEPKAGGQYRIDWESVSGENNHHRHGEYLRVVENELIEFEWLGFQDKELSDRRTRVTISLEPTGDGTKLRLSHTGWGETDTWKSQRDMHEVGWHFYMDNLARAVASDAGSKVVPLPAQVDLRAMAFGQKTGPNPSTASAARVRV